MSLCLSFFVFCILSLSLFTNCRIFLCTCRIHLHYWSDYLDLDTRQKGDVEREPVEATLESAPCLKTLEHTSVLIQRIESLRSQRCQSEQTFSSGFKYQAFLCPCRTWLRCTQIVSFSSSTFGLTSWPTDPRIAQLKLACQKKKFSLEKMSRFAHGLGSQTVTK